MINRIAFGSNLHKMRLKKQMDNSIKAFQKAPMEIRRCFGVVITKKDIEKMTRKKQISEEEFEKFSTERYNRRETTKNLAYLMYFDDFENKEVTDYVKEVSKKVDAISDGEKLELDEEEEERFNQIQAKFRFQYKTAEEANQHFKTILYNKRLLRAFLSNLKAVNKTSILLLFDLLERNLSLVKEAEEQERENWKVRRTTLQRINSRLDLRFRFEVLDRAKIQKDECYLKIKQFILHRMRGEDSTLNNTADLCVKMLKFEKKLDKDFLDTVASQIDTFDIENVVDPDLHLGSIASKTLLLLKRMKIDRMAPHGFILGKVKSLQTSLLRHLDFTKLKPNDAFSLYINGPYL